MINQLIEWSAKNRFFVLLIIFFLVLRGVWVITHMPLDAIPDLSDVQVTIYTDWMGRNPQIMEDQVTYPITTAMLSAPHVKAVRGISGFGSSFVYVIFEDGTDLYWARTRVLEYLEKIKDRIPSGVSPVLAPDATGVGWVYIYALTDKTGQHDLAQLRSLQDWSLKYYLESIPDVAEVATYGGYVREYQVEVDPNRLLAYHIPLKMVADAIRANNQEVGGGAIELAQTEYMVRGLGYVQKPADLEKISLGASMGGAPIHLKDVAHVTLGPDMRRGVADLNGEGDVVSGVVVMRYGKNALDVINRVKAAIEEFKKTRLPPGVEIVPVYDRSDLILRSIDNLKRTLIEESIIVILVCLIFLFSFRSALVVIIMLPIAIAMAFVPMAYMHLTSNIMSLGGIAIAIGAMVDAAVVMIENVHKRLEHAPPGADRNQVIVDAIKEVGRPLYYSLLVITVSFLPVFTLESQEGRLFKPLAFTKTFSMFAAALLSVTLVPAIMGILVGRKVIPESRNPLNRLLIAIYNPIARFELKFRFITLSLGAAAIFLAYPAFKKLGTEFMPPLYEGTFLYMPMTTPGISIGEARRTLQLQDKLLKQVPEVDTVLGKAGRATTPTDPAPLPMVETVLALKPEDQWPKNPDGTPETWEDLSQKIDQAVRLPGYANVITMPIKNRVDMISTGIRTPVGIKVFGPRLDETQRLAEEIERTLKDANVSGTRSVIAERSLGGYYLNITPNREALARYELSIMGLQDVIETAIGGNVLSTTVEGRERYPINIRYPRELRGTPEALNRVLIATPMGYSVPLSQVADIQLVKGPDMIRSERGELTGTVYVDVSGRDIGSYVADLKKVVSENIAIPQGYSLVWSGQYEYMQRVAGRLKYMIPLTLFLIFLLIYMNFGNVTKTLIVMLSVPFALVGGILTLAYLHFNLSVAVWVGIIALAGVAAETGVVMLVYIDDAYERRRREGRMANRNDLYEAIIEGSVQRVRPKMMTVVTIMAGLLPILWSHGTGADVMKRIAAPMVGGMLTSTLLTLFVIPSLYYLWKSFSLPRSPKRGKTTEAQSRSAD